MFGWESWPLKIHLVPACRATSMCCVHQLCLSACFNCTIHQCTNEQNFFKVINIYITWRGGGSGFPSADVFEIFMISVTKCRCHTHSFMLRFFGSKGSRKTRPMGRWTPCRWSKAVPLGCGAGCGSSSSGAGKAGFKIMQVIVFPRVCECNDILP